MQGGIESAARDFFLCGRPEHCFHLAFLDAFGADGDEKLQQRGRAGVGFQFDRPRIGARPDREIAETGDLERGLKILFSPHGATAATSRCFVVGGISRLSADHQKTMLRKRRAIRLP